MPIDYSKWDNLEVSSSSEDEDDAPQPRVTRLDAPSSVTFGGKDGTVSAASKPAVVLAPKEIPKSAPSSTKNISPSWTDHGGLLRAKLKNGEERKLHWSQDRYSVTLRLELDTGVKVQSVQVEGILPFADRWWRRPLTHFPEADLAVIRGENSTNQQGGASKEFLEAWEEAHKIFRENKQKRDPKPM